MKKSQCLIVVITGLLLILPLFQAQGNTTTPNLHNLQTDQVKLTEKGSQDSRQKLAQCPATSLNYAQDYISQEQSPPRLMAAVPDGELVSYKAFDGTTYSLQQYTGKYTAILMKPENVEFYTLAQLRALLDQSDLLYAYYKEIVPTEPDGGDITTIAFVDIQDRNQDGHIVGLGLLGVKGIEVDFSKLQAIGIYPYDVIVHEMAHNFDKYSRAIMVGPDPVHAWTTFCGNYLST